MGFPGRVQRLEAARERFGADADWIAGLYAVGDPGADGELGPVPDWLDLERCDRGGAVLRRFGPLGLSVLRCYTLPLSYLSPEGIKPLLATERLTADTGRRLYETARFIQLTQQPGAMHPGGPGWQSSIRVRRVHGRVRAMMRKRGWDEATGAPIPQPDLASTAMLFGPLNVDGLRKLGARISEEEADAVAHLYHWVGHLQGVQEGLIPDTHAGCMARFELLTCMNAPPNEGSVQLMEALLGVSEELSRRPLDPVWAALLTPFYRSLAGRLLGPEVSEAIHLNPRRRWSFWLPALVPLYPRSRRWTAVQDRLNAAILAREVVETP